MPHLYMKEKPDCQMKVSVQQDHKDHRQIHKLVRDRVNMGELRLQCSTLLMLVPVHPVRFAPSARDAVDSSVDIDLKVGPAHRTLAVHPGHRLHLVHRVLEAHQPCLTVEHTPCAYITDHPDISQHVRMFWISFNRTEKPSGRQTPSTTIPVGKGA